MPANFQLQWQQAINYLYEEPIEQYALSLNETLSLKDIVKRISNAFQKAIKHIYSNGNYDPSMLSDPNIAPLIIETNNAYTEALQKGIEKRRIPTDMMKMLEDNIFIFSGFKTHAELSEVSALLMDNGKLKPFEKFKQDVKDIDQNYNTNYLRAEYNFAVSSSRSAAMWADLSKDSDKYFLQYRTAKDERVRAEHATLDEITLPADDPFWKDYFPPNGWNCRCTVVKVRRSKYTESNSEEAIKRGIKATTKINKKGQNKAAIFRFNPGMEQKVFPPRHPYYKVSKDNRTKINDSINVIKKGKH